MRWLCGFRGCLGRKTSVVVHNAESGHKEGHPPDESSGGFVPLDSPKDFDAKGQAAYKAHSKPAVQLDALGPKSQRRAELVHEASGVAAVVVATAAAKGAAEGAAASGQQHELLLRALLHRAKASMPKSAALGPCTTQEPLRLEDAQLLALAQQLLALCRTAHAGGTAASVSPQLQAVLQDLQRWLTSRPASPSAAASLLYAAGEGLARAEHHIRSAGQVRFWQPDTVAAFAALLQLYSELLQQAGRAQAPAPPPPPAMATATATAAASAGPQLEASSSSARQPPAQGKQHARSEAGGDGAERQQGPAGQPAPVRDGGSTASTSGRRPSGPATSPPGQQRQHQQHHHLALRTAVAALLLRPDWLELLSDVLELLHFSEPFTAAAARSGSSAEVLGTALQLWGFLTRLVKFAALHPNHVPRMDACLARLAALLAPPSGVVPRVLSLPVAADSLPAQLHALRLLQELYDLPDSKTLYSDALAGHYISYHWRAMTSQYEASGADPRTAAADLCLVHATLIRSLARHQGAPVRQAFQRLGAVEWLLREISLESQMLAAQAAADAAAQQGSDADDASESSDMDSGSALGGSSRRRSSQQGPTEPGSSSSPRGQVSWSRGADSHAAPAGTAADIAAAAAGSAKFSFTYDLNEDVERLLELEARLGKDVELDGFEYDEEGKRLMERSQALRSLDAQGSSNRQAAGQATTTDPAAAAAAAGQQHASTVGDERASGGTGGEHGLSGLSAVLAGPRPSSVPRLSLGGLRVASVSSVGKVGTPVHSTARGTPLAPTLSNANAWGNMSFGDPDDDDDDDGFGDDAASLPPAAAAASGSGYAGSLASSRARELTTASGVHYGANGDLHLLTPSSARSRLSPLPLHNSPNHNHNGGAMVTWSPAPPAPALTRPPSVPPLRTGALGAGPAGIVEDSPHAYALSSARRAVLPSSRLGSVSVQELVPVAPPPVVRTSSLPSSTASTPSSLSTATAAAAAAAAKACQPRIPSLNLSTLQQRQGQQQQQQQGSGAGAVAPVPGSASSTSRSPPLSTILRTSGRLPHGSAMDSAATPPTAPPSVTSSVAPPGFGHGSGGSGGGVSAHPTISPRTARSSVCGGGGNSVVRQPTYQDLACRKLLYQDPALHTLLLKVLLDLIVSPSAGLDPAYVAQLPADCGALHAEHILLWHLNAPANECLVQELHRGVTRSAQHALKQLQQRAAQHGGGGGGSSHRSEGGPPSPALPGAVAPVPRPPATARLLRLLTRQLFDGNRYTNLQFQARGAHGAVYRARMEASPQRALLPSGPTQTATAAQSEQHQVEQQQPQGPHAPQAVIIKTIELPGSAFAGSVLSDVYGEVSIMERFRGCGGVCQLLDYGMHNDAYWIVMKRYRCSLAEWRGRQKPLAAPPSDAACRVYLAILLQVADALKVLAAQAVVHFDLKCANVLVEPLLGVTDSALWAPVDANRPSAAVAAPPASGAAAGAEVCAASAPACSAGVPGRVPFRCVLADFGEARAYRSTAEAFTARNRGTEVFKSPEMLMLNMGGMGGSGGATGGGATGGAQHPGSSPTTAAGVHGQPALAGAGLASDIWSLGCLAYELLSGTVLFGADYASVTHRVALGAGENLRLTPEERARLGGSQRLAALVEWVLVRDPAKRPSLDAISARISQEITALAVA